MSINIPNCYRSLDAYKHVLIAALTILGLSFAQNLAADSPLSYNDDIRPILSDKCFPCHGPDAQVRKADLRLDRFRNVEDVRGGESVLIPSNIDASELIRRITSEDNDERMPPVTETRQLTAHEIERLRQWVAQGAKYESHWAFMAPSRPRLPDIHDIRWPRNGIDYFVLERLEQADLTPSPPDDLPNLVRRASLDIIGLPPEVGTMNSVCDESSYGQFVDGLLSSSRYGEHWATMWLDAARYADTNGYNNDTPRYNWRYREWVIQALNRNLPYDQFVTEQLAGDLLPESKLDQQIATGFNRNHNVTSEGGIVDEEYRLEYVADRVQTTSTVFMALTVRCARCHDHKFDPISQREYYQLFAFFNQVPETGYHKEHVGNPNPVVKAPDAGQAKQLELATRELTECEQQLAEIAKDLSGEEQKTNGEFLRLVARQKALSQKQKAIDDVIPTAMVMRDVEQPRTTFMLRRGAYDQPLNEVEMDVPSMLPPFPPDAPRNRLGFAQWLVSREHPLTARVIVNRLWAEVFGRGLVTTLEDFGTQGASPSHPQLLDWLAVELVESGWNLRHILRLMVTSSTYRQTAILTPELLKTDPDNQLLARGPRFRMKAEVIRDSALAVSGLLVHRLGGPSVRPYQPKGLWIEVAVADDSYSGGPYVQSHGEDLYRRSVYDWWKRTCPPPNLNMLDAPEREFCLVQRSRTNTPLQALVLLNDPTFVEAARKLAERMILEGRDKPQSRLAYGFQLATGRELNASELELLMHSLQRFHDRFSLDKTAATHLLSVGESALPNIDQTEHAAYTAVASILLNLDEFVTK